MTKPVQIPGFQCEWSMVPALIVVVEVEGKQWQVRETGGRQTEITTILINK